MHVEIGDKNKCDFCSESAPLWVYPARSFKVQAFSTPGMAVNSIDEWRCCDGCHALIEADKWRELAERSKERIRLDVPLEIFEGIHAEFRQNRDGPPHIRTD